MGMYKARYQGTNPKGRRVTTQLLINAKSLEEAKEKASGKVPEVQQMLTEREQCNIEGLQCTAIEDRTSTQRK